MPTISKLVQISRLALGNPSELRERLVGRMDRSLERRQAHKDVLGAVDLSEAVALLGKLLNVPLSAALMEPTLAATEETTAVRASELQRVGRMPPEMNADVTLARFCYAACRAMKPLAVLETGVASGVTTTFILAAMEMNGSEGALWSVDLPPLAVEAESHVGAIVPEDLRKRWHLRLGPSRNILPALLNQIGTVDVFVHDSLHTRRNMLAEFEMVWPRLRTGGLLIADDVNMNGAFDEFSDGQHRGQTFKIRQKGKDSCFGVLLKQPQFAQG